MSITTNTGGVLHELSAVTTNVGGVLRNLDTVHTTDGGVLRELFSAGGETTTEATVTLSGATINSNVITAAASFSGGAAVNKSATTSLIRAGCTVYCKGSSSSGYQCGAGASVQFRDADGTLYQTVATSPNAGDIQMSSSGYVGYTLLQDTTLYIIAGASGTAAGYGSSANVYCYIVNANGDRIILTT